MDSNKTFIYISPSMPVIISMYPLFLLTHTLTLSN